LSSEFNIPQTELDTPLQRLQIHLRRAWPHASAYRQVVDQLHREYHPAYNPLYGWDHFFREKREKQAYVPVPLVWFTVNVMSALMGMRAPIIKMEPKSADEKDRNDAERTELLLKYESQRQNLKEVHLDMAKVLSLKGRAALKVGYDGTELWTENIDNIENLWTEWADDSYKRVRSYTYHSLISPEQARDDYSWNGTGATTMYDALRKKDGNAPQYADHQNFLGLATRPNKTLSGRQQFVGVPLIDFHYKNTAGKVVNSLFLGNGQQVEEKVTKLPDFPYIPINCDTEPGNPFGIGDAEPTVMFQKEISTRITDWAEAVRRNGQDQWKTFNVRGLSPRDLPGGGRVFPLGSKEDEDVMPLKYPVDNIGYGELLTHLYDEYRRTTGIPPEVLGGGGVPTTSSGYAMAIRFQSVVTRLGPREVRMGTLYQRWAELTLKNMEIVEPDTKELIQGNYFTKIDFTAVTPRDFAATVNSLSQAISSGMLSRRSAMEEINKVPEDEETYIGEWNADPKLSPGTAGAIVSVQGQMDAIANGSNQAAAQQAQAGSDKAMPGNAGQNQHTMPGNHVGPMRDTAAQLMGVGPSITSPVAIHPPFMNPSEV